METKLLEYFKQFVVKRIFAWGKSSSNAQNKIQELVTLYVDGLITSINNR